MDLEAFQTSLEALATAAEQAFSTAKDSDAFEAAREIPWRLAVAK
ncbi:MAG: hypothetical protein R3C56_12270 [Pirellulaceae bacterium]